MSTPTSLARVLALSTLLSLTGSELVQPAPGQTTPKAQIAAANKARGFSDAGKVAITKQLEAAVSRGDTPGVVALVVDRDGVIYEGAAGKADVGRNAAMPVNAIFSIASMTKPVTSVAIMMLLEQGK